MPIETVPGTDLSYFLIAFDKDGRERAGDPAGLMSFVLTDALKRDPVTDVFLISHGWKGDIPAARGQYGRWIACMAECKDDIAGLRGVRPAFQAMSIGVHWPSLPFGDEEFGAGGLSFALDAAPLHATPLDALIESYAERLADTAAARAALATIFQAAQQDVAPGHLPPDVQNAYRVLDRESNMGSAGEGAAPGDDREPFDPERAFQASLDDTVSFGDADLGGVLAPLRQLSFWKMKDRARRFGESGGAALLAQLQGAAEGRDVRFHLMGHSFGCIVVSAMLAGPAGAPKPLRPIDSVTLVQGALSHWSYCADIPAAPGTRGYFHSIVAAERVAGPIITTQSEHDSAVGRLYPLAAGAARQVAYAVGELPKYGALGTFGVRGPGIKAIDLDMKAAAEPYAFERAAVYNLDSSRFIKSGGGLAGAHNDIARPEVAHAVWQAVRAGI